MNLVHNHTVPQSVIRGCDHLHEVHDPAPESGVLDPHERLREAKSGKPRSKPSKSPKAKKKAPRQRGYVDDQHITCLLMGTRGRLRSIPGSSPAAYAN